VQEGCEAFFVQLGGSASWISFGVGAHFDDTMEVAQWNEIVEPMNWW